MVDLSVRLGPLRLAHPLINASGTFDLLALAELCGLDVIRRPPVAAYVPKTVTLTPREGNPPPRLAETAAGVINSVGLPGKGLTAFMQDELPQLVGLPCPVIVSVGGFAHREYAEAAKLLHEWLNSHLGQDWEAQVGLELNISCPNVHSGCVLIGSDPAETSAVVEAVRAEWPGLLIVKLTPNVADITAIGRAAVMAGADALSAVNTYKGLVLDRVSLRPYLGNITGGLSGPAIKPLALRAVYELYASVEVPIIGMGGVASVQDVIEFIACGAMVVAVGSALFRDPCFAKVLAESLPRALEERGLDLTGLRGLAHRSPG